MHYARLSTRGTSLFHDELVADDGRQLTTYSALTEETRLPQSQAFWKNNLLPHGYLLGSLRKHYYYDECFALLECFDLAGNLAGYYVDITTPLRKVGEDYYVTDLFLDYWLAPGQPPVGLDEDEFDEAVAAGALTTEQIAQARSSFARVHDEIAAGIFPSRYIQA